MRLLELFSGTHSVGRVAKRLGFDVVSLDLTDADIETDILLWDYMSAYPPGHFDIIWASPECTTFSNLRRSWIGRSLKAFGDVIITPEILDKDMDENGVPLLRKTQEIIEYFKPTYWFIENPQSSKMKDFIDSKPYQFDYCMYGFPYKKPTNIWSNKDLTSHRCDKSHLINNRHEEILGDFPSRQNKSAKYRVPEPLIEELLGTSHQASIANLD